MALQSRSADSNTVAATVRQLPPAPLASNLQHLAKSPASALLLSDFFALERQRELSQLNGATSPGNSQPLFQPLAPAQTKLAPQTTPGNALPALSSDFPQYSATLDGSFRLDEYHPLDEIYAFIDALPRRYKHIQVFTIGRSAENRPIKALELINNSTDAEFVWLDALTHAREWITGTTMLYIIDQLVSQHSSSNAKTVAAFNKNYIIVPVVNPDGYAYTWSTNRMWRKNRSRSSNRAADSKCVGVSIMQMGKFFIFRVLLVDISGVFPQNTPDVN